MTFATRKIKGKNIRMLKENNEVSASTQGSYETRMIVIETKVYEMKTWITTQVKNTAEQQ